MEVPLIKAETEVITEGFSEPDPVRTGVESGVFMIEVII